MTAVFADRPLAPAVVLHNGEVVGIWDRRRDRDGGHAQRTPRSQAFSVPLFVVAKI
jgi:hypothetical protein